MSDRLRLEYVFYKLSLASTYPGLAPLLIESARVDGITFYFDEVKSAVI